MDKIVQAYSWCMHSSHVQALPHVGWSIWSEPTVAENGRQDPDVFVNAFAIEEALQMHESNGYWTLSSKKAWGILGRALGPALGLI